MWAFSQVASLCGDWWIFSVNRHEYDLFEIALTWLLVRIITLANLEMNVLTLVTLSLNHCFIVLGLLRALISVLPYIDFSIGYSVTWSLLILQGNPTSNCNSPSSDKENNDSNSSPKKWVPPKVFSFTICELVELSVFVTHVHSSGKSSHQYVISW